MGKRVCETSVVAIKRAMGKHKNRKNMCGGKGPENMDRSIVWFQKISIPLPRRVFNSYTPTTPGISIPRDE